MVSCCVAGTVTLATRGVLVDSVSAFQLMYSTPLLTLALSSATAMASPAE